VQGLRSFANKVQPVFKNLPQLPENFKKTLVSYLHIIVLVLAILGALGVLAALVAVLGAFTVIATFGGVVFGGLAAIGLIIALLAIALSAVTVVLYFMAYKPLQAKQEKGWLLLFAVSLFGVMSCILNFVAGRIGSGVGSLLESLVILYILFQVRSYYTGSAQPTVSTLPTEPIEAQIIHKK
jgi:hypothetical protein